MKQKPLELSASYMETMLFNPDKLLRKARRDLAKVQFDTMIGMGLSGAIFIPMLARSMKKQFMIVRKKDGSHSSRSVEGRLGQRWIFVDDLIDSGATLARVKNVIGKICLGEQHAAKYIGTYLYQGGSDSDPGFHLPGKERKNVF